MEGEPFEFYDAPRFLDFAKKQQEFFDDSADAFFEVNHENEGESYFTPVSQNFGVMKTESSEESYEEVSHTKLRKSMSVGNLIMFNEEGNRYDHQPNLDDICENVKELNVSHNATKVQKTVKQECKGSKSFRSSNPSLNPKSSQEYLNKLAQPKRYASVENLKEGNNGKFVSMAEAVNKFQNRTPVRFRSKPNLQQHNYQPLQRTVPESPALQTKMRSRPTNILSHEEREKIEYEQELKFKIKANPVNKKILKGPLKPVAPVEKKPATVIQPFNISENPRKKTAPSPQKYEFHARPMPRSAEKCRKVQEVQRRELTKPKTPTFMKNYKAPSHKVLTQNEPKKEDKCKSEKPKPNKTKPEPFSFDHRDKMIQKKREQYIQKMMEEERRAREFHARPVPKAIYKRTDSMDSGSSVGSSKKCHSSNENISNQFKARPPTVLFKQPFIPQKSEKPPTQVVPFQLESDIRVQEREAFERELRRKEEMLELVKREKEEERRRQEEEEIARIRKETQYQAKPIRKYKELTIPSPRKLTIPMSPKFQSTTLRARQNKENVPDNSL